MHPCFRKYILVYFPKNSEDDKRQPSILLRCRFCYSSEVPEMNLLANRIPVSV